jgi:sarcosine/dimethylglycine N-methyltransferase
VASAEGGIGTVVRFYETHPINERQILGCLEAAGVALEGLTEDVLQEHDQDHFGGLAAVDELARRAGIGPGCRVLDVCSGVGGPARYLAHRYGCRVTGLDITESRHEAAVRLTRLVGLDHAVDFRLGNALAMPFGDGAFDVVIGQEAWAHVPNKPRLVAECARVARPGGRIAFTDILKGRGLTAAQEERLRQEMTFLELATAGEYRGLLEASRCRVLEEDDLGAAWAEILRRRLAMYRSLETSTVERFGAEHFRRWDDTYAFFVGLFATGELAGGRFVAERVAAAAPPG